MFAKYLVILIGISVTAKPNEQIYNIHYGQKYDGSSSGNLFEGTAKGMLACSIRCARMGKCMYAQFNEDSDVCTLFPGIEDQTFMLASSGDMFSTATYGPASTANGIAGSGSGSSDTGMG